MRESTKRIEEETRRISKALAKEEGEFRPNLADKKGYKKIAEKDNKKKWPSKRLFLGPPLDTHSYLP